MKNIFFKKIIFSFILLLILLNRIQAQTKTVAQIDKYVKSVSSLMKKTKHRIFADTASDGRAAKWKEFKTEKLRDAADNGDNLNENAYVWLKNGKVISTTYTFQSPSRDWAQFVTYYFRADGTLAKAETALNTFYGNVTVEHNFYFNSKGKLIKRNVKYFDLETQKPINIKERQKQQEFYDEQIELFKNTNKLPFIKLLKKKMVKTRK